MNKVIIWTIIGFLLVIAVSAQNVVEWRGVWNERVMEKEQAEQVKKALNSIVAIAKSGGGKVGNIVVEVRDANDNDRGNSGSGGNGGKIPDYCTKVWSSYDPEHPERGGYGGCY